MNNHLIGHKTLKWELMIRWSQCNDVTMSRMLKISVWWSTIWSLCGDNDNHFHPGIIIEMLTTFCLRSSNHPGITSDGWRFHGESTVILDDDYENNNVKGSDYFSIMTWWQQWWNKAKGCLFRSITSIIDNYNSDDIDTDKIVTRILIMVVMVMKMMNITIMMLGDGRDKQCWKVHKEAVSNI